MHTPNSLRYFVRKNIAQQFLRERTIKNDWQKALPSIDEGIRPAVKLLNENGFETFESCEGGRGHCFSEPTVRFYGTEQDLIAAYELLESSGLNVHNARRVFRKQPVYDASETIAIGSNWQAPFNEIVFIKHSKTGTIYLPV